MTGTSPPSLKAIASSLLIFVSLAASVHFVVGLEKQSRVTTQQARVGDAARAVLSRLEAELNANIHLANGLTAYINAVDQVDALRIQVALQTLHRQGRHIRNIGLAPGNRITYVYPLEGNEAAIGLYYPDQAEQWSDVHRAIESRATVLAGPLLLKQGGTGLISRTPVFLAGQRYWGMISIVLDADGLLEAAGIRAEVDGVRYALRRVDPGSARATVFLGSPELFEDDTVRLSLELPGVVWELAARPADGWRGASQELALLETGALLFSALLALASLTYLTGKARLASSERRLRLFMNTAQEGVIVIDQNGLVQEFNPAAEQLFGYSAGEMLGTSLNRLMPQADARRHDGYLGRESNGQARNMSGGREVVGVRKDGSRFPIEVTVGEARIGDDTLHIGVVRDISERKAIEQQLLQAATTDSLTSALTRRAFMEAARDAFTLAQRHHHPISVMMIDVDHFKQINDAHGHPVGDQVLIDLVQQIATRLRQTDKLGRYGGEEFIVLLPHTDLDKAARVAEKLLRGIRTSELHVPGAGVLRYTISIGVAAMSAQSSDVEMLIDAADRALYFAKASGRDRYCTADD